ncbi:MAG: YceI family protein [Melioribacter sp.]|nr:YceI family protein [Melioribacter sp.]
MQAKINGIIILLFIQLSIVLSQSKQIEAVKQESSITYQLTHPLHEIESTSKDANCTIDLDLSKKEIKKVFVQVDVTSFNSGNSSRDSHAMEVIDALSFPDSRFTSSSITQKGDSLKVYGKLTFHGITKDIVISAFTKWSNNKLMVNGNFDISLTEFKVERPSLLLIPVKDGLKFILTQVFNL